MDSDGVQREFRIFPEDPIEDRVTADNGHMTRAMDQIEPMCFSLNPGVFLAFLKFKFQKRCLENPLENLES